MDSEKEEIAAVAARMVVEEGLEYGPAKRRAVRQMGLSPRVALPDNAQIEAAVEEYIAIYCAQEQREALRTLREIALEWMRRLAAFRPHLGGAVWRGTATQHSDIYLQLFCDDSKSAEIALIDMGLNFDVRQVPGFQGDLVDALSLSVPVRQWGQTVGVHLLIHDLDDVRGALKPDARGRTWRGNAYALSQLMEEAAHDRA